MKVAFFSTHQFERKYYQSTESVQFVFFEMQLNQQTASLAANCSAVCAFVSDAIDAATVKKLAEVGVGLIALRSAGYNHVDLKACAQHGVRVVRVPAYSPHAVAEHALALLLCLNRKIHRAYNRVRELNFSLDGLIGYDLNKKTVGVIGTGSIGSVFGKIMQGLGCEVVAYDKVQNSDFQFLSLEELFRVSDIISLHVPLNQETRHLINAESISLMKPGVTIINTGRGGLIDTRALIAGLKSNHIGGACLDVYEEEEGIFFSDLSQAGISDDTLARLLTFPQVIITAHQAFLTHEALENISTTTIENILAFQNNNDGALTNEVRA
ncbi:2-hydroxyacid dehydrogenase [bacterium]|nr:2-hydroxyacid dehydrogenase [bacterium]